MYYRQTQGGQFPGQGVGTQGFPGGFPGGGFPGGGFPGFPGFPGGGNVERRLDRLERRVDQLDRRLDRVERRLGMREETYY